MKLNKEPEPKAPILSNRYDSNEHRKYFVFYLEPIAKKNTCGLYEEY